MHDSDGLRIEEVKQAATVISPSHRIPTRPKQSFSASLLAHLLDAKVQVKMNILPKGSGSPLVCGYPRNPPSVQHAASAGPFPTAWRMHVLDRRMLEQLCMRSGET